MNILTHAEARQRDLDFDEPRTDSTRTQAEKVAIVDAAMALDTDDWTADECERCTTDAHGIVYCDAHRPKPTAPHVPICCICQRPLGDGGRIVTGIRGLRWHSECAE